MFNFLASKNKLFYELFDKAAVNVSKGAQAMVDLLQYYPTALGEKVSHIKDIEHEGDQITHQVVEMINKTFVTPIEREDIYELITKLDDVIDWIDNASRRLALYKITYVTDEAKAFGQILLKASNILKDNISHLRIVKNYQKEILPRCVEIHSLENEGDELMRKAMMLLFEGKKDDPIYVIKWKEIYEQLEAAVDRCEDVANIVEGIVLKNA